MASRYQRVPTSAGEHEEEHELSAERPLSASTLAEFNRVPPPWWQRALILVAILALGWFAAKVGGIGGSKSPEIVYATR